MSHLRKLVHLRFLHFYPFFSGLFLAFEELDPVLKDCNIVLCLLSQLPLLEHLDTFFDKIRPILLIIECQLWSILCTWRGSSLLLISSVIIDGKGMISHVRSENAWGLLALRLNIVEFLLELFKDLRMARDTFFYLLGQGSCTMQSFTDRCRYFERVSHRSLIGMSSLSWSCWAAL